MPNLVQIKNPRTGLYVLVDRDNGEIVEHKESSGPYEGMPMAKMRTIKDPVQTPGGITVEQARAAAKTAKYRKKQPKPRTGFLHGDDPTLAKNFEQRMNGVTPEEAARLVVDGNRNVSPEAIAFSRRFNEQYRETLRDLANS